MITVWKFALAMEPVQDIRLPRGAKLLTVQPQGEFVNLWAMVDSNAELINHRIAILGTRHAAPDYGRLAYISTFQLRDGALVFHAFEITNSVM